MNFRQIAMIQKLKSDVNLFRANHPKFPMFLKAVSQNAIEEGSIVMRIISFAEMLHLTK